MIYLGISPGDRKVKLDLNTIITGAASAIIGAWLWEAVVRPAVIKNTETQA